MAHRGINVILVAIPRSVALLIEACATCSGAPCSVEEQDEAFPFLTSVHVSFREEGWALVHRNKAFAVHLSVARFLAKEANACEGGPFNVWGRGNARGSAPTTFAVAFWGTYAFSVTFGFASFDLALVASFVFSLWLPSTFYFAFAGLALFLFP